MWQRPGVKPFAVGDLIEINQYCASDHGGTRVKYVPGDIGVITSLIAVDSYNSCAIVYLKGREENFYLDYLNQLTPLDGAS